MPEPEQPQKSEADEQIAKTITTFVKERFRPLDMVKRDWPWLIVTIFTMSAVIYDIYFSGDYQERCNAFWIEQIKTFPCYHSPDVQTKLIAGMNYTRPFTHPLDFRNDTTHLVPNNTEG